MERQLFFDEEPTSDFQAVSPLLEMGAYEALWLEKGATYKRLAEKLSEQPPSSWVPDDLSRETANRVLSTLRSAGVGDFEIRLRGDFEYPAQLLDLGHPREVLYFQGWWFLAQQPSVSIVGTRTPSDEGLRRTRKLARELVADGWVVASGLAKGVDAAAHRAAIDAGGRTIGVLGTPLTISYPRENAELQKELAQDHLVVSQVPVLHHSEHDHRTNRRFFPERNRLMAALSEATVIVEAGETSGTLIQARSALTLGRKLFVLDSCFRNPKLNWPHRLVEKGAIRVRDFNDIRETLDVPPKDR